MQKLLVLMLSAALSLSLVACAEYTVGQLKSVLKDPDSI